MLWLISPAAGAIAAAAVERQPDEQQARARKATGRPWGTLRRARQRFAVSATATPLLPLAPAPFGVYYTHGVGLMRSREVIGALERAGWEQVRQKGSHLQFKHPQQPGLVTVPHPNPDIPIGTLKSIEKQSGLKLR